jgi:hypothetical protein
MGYHVARMVATSHACRTFVRRLHRKKYLGDLAVRRLENNIKTDLRREDHGNTSRNELV